MDIKGLSDTKLAIFTYAMENFCDNIEENNWIKSFEDEANNILEQLEEEYSKRKLDCDNYYTYTQADVVEQ